MKEGPSSVGTQALDGELGATTQALLLTQGSLGPSDPLGLEAARPTQPHTQSQGSRKQGEKGTVSGVLQGFKLRKDNASWPQGPAPPDQAGDTGARRLLPGVQQGVPCSCHLYQLPFLV